MITEIIAITPLLNQIRNQYVPLIHDRHLDSFSNARNLWFNVF